MAKIQDSLREAHPDSPWLWRADWASGRMRSSRGAAAVVAWVFAIAFMGLSSPLVWQARDIVAKKGIGVALVAALFPLAGILLCVRAVFETGRWLRFRGMQLELWTLPGVVGGSFRATVHAGQLLAAEGDFHARLSCMKETKSGKETTTSTVWQGELTIPITRFERGPFGTALPVAFQIPFECEPSSADPGQALPVTWRLDVQGELRGADFWADFEVPIFKTDASSPEVSERFEPGAPAESESTWSDDVSAKPLDDRRILVGRAPDGSLEIRLPASRNRLGAAMITGFAAFWNGFIFFAGRQFSGLFLVFLAPFVLVGLGLVAVVPFVWLQSSTIRARRGMLVLEQQFLGKVWSREVPVEEIQAIAPVARGMNGQRASWSVEIQSKGRQRSREMVQNLRSKADAQTIAAMLMRAISVAE